MAKRKPIEQTAAAAKPGTTSADLPHVESPPLSPAGAEPVSSPAEPPAPLVETAPAPAAKPDFKWRPRHKRAAFLAASVTLAAAVGAVIGVVSSQGFAVAKPPADVAGLEQSKAVQQSLVHLSKQVASLKVSLEAAHKAAQNFAAKAANRLAAMDEITGSITPLQAVPPAPEPQAAIPLPAPRPAAQEIAVAEPPAAMRPALVADWTIRSARDGMAYVEGHGEIYQAVLGAALPGLGPVQTIKREDGRWMVVTPRGIIVSARDRRYFE
jgi:hypothetical protein